MRARFASWLFLLVSFPVVLSAAFPERQWLHGHVPAVTATLSSVDRFPADSDLELAIGLPLRNKEALTNLLEQLYDPASTNYHHFLSAEQFAEQFGPTAADYQAVMAFVETNGLTVNHTHPNRTLLEVNGSVANIEKVFHVMMREYKHPTEARTFFAPDVEPSVDLQVPLLAINGLNNYIIPRPASHRGLDAALPGSGTGPNGNYLGNDFRTAYVPGVSLTGAGQVVALLELDGYYTNDIAAYKTLAGLPNIPITNIYVANFTGTPSSNANSVGEVSLDIEMVMSMAPGISKVMVYEAANCCNNWITILNQMATDNAAKQISTSWLVGDNSSADQVYQQFAAHGQSFFQCSGDDGSFYTGVPQYADSPYLTTVGGTTLTTGTASAWSSEKTWNNYFDGQGTNSSGGGISRTYSIPTWQQGVSMSVNGGSTNMRNVPDVSMVADRVWVRYNNGSAGWFWGTSCAAPLWAGFTALVNQRALAAGKTNVGFVNPAIYALGKSTNYPLYFHDITTGNNTNFTNPTSFFAVTGYDLCTGWGTPIGSNLITALALGPGFPEIISQPTNQVIPQGANVTFSGTVIGSAPFSYQWQLNGTNLADNGHLTGSLSNSLAITNAQLADAGNYQLMISNSSGAVTSSIASLTIYIVPAITSQPQSLTIPANSNATFSVGSVGTPVPSYQWKFGGTNIAGATNPSYTIANAQLANQGAYSVALTNIYGSATSSNATLIVQSPPVITVEPVSSRAVNPGTSAFFFATVTGSPTLFYSWLFSSNGFSTATNIVGLTNSAFNIASVKTANAGNYWVVISNTFGAVTSTVSVLQVNASPIITSQPQNLSVARGSNATFSVTATGSPTPNYQWFFNNASIGGATAGSYTIANAQTNNAGNYFVIVTNTLGSVTSSVVTLSVTLPQAPQFQSIVLLPNGQVQMVLSGQVGGNYAIDGSTDLVTWIELTNFINTNGIFRFTDLLSTNTPRDFYRAHTLP